MNSFEKLEKLMAEQGSKYDLPNIRRAYDFCKKAHGSQKRLSGEPFYMHPFSVACILVQLGMDSESVEAALLHDVVEDTDVTLEQVKSEFGEDVAELVDGVTKFGKMPLVTHEQQLSENVRKMMMAMAKDIRVIIIKLADRLHNMRTIDAQSRDKQLEKSVETLEIYAPIAHRLGISAVKEELEDIAIAHLDPIAYHEIEQLLDSHKSHREQFLKSISERIEKRVKQYVPNITLTGRIKSIHGIYRKMYIQGKSFDEIYDIYAVRIITDTVANCYNILGVIHDMFQPIPGRFKDYISMPKPNMYQSLHTTVVGREALPFEVQIRTWEMHHTAEYGIAAHWKYKEGIQGSDAKLEERLGWIRQILETQREADDAEDIVQTIKNDLSQEDVFAVTPKGDVINLPAGSTVIDFAYAIHSAVGQKMVGAKVDGKIVPLSHVINMGEIVEILTTNQPGHGPSRDWLNVAKTSQARNKIRSWFKKERREENIENGKAEIEREFSRNGIKLNDGDMAEFIDDIAHRQNCATADDFYASLGFGGIQLSRIMPRIKEDYNRKYKENEVKTLDDIVTETKRTVSGDGVYVEGIDNCLIKLSRCCDPIPGDDIIGFITRGHGVSIHKRDCSNVPADISKCEEPERWVKAGWAKGKSTYFKCNLRLSCIDRPTLLADISLAVAGMRIPLHAVNARPTPNGGSAIDITVGAEGVEHIKNICKRLEKINGVLRVDRVGN